MSKPSSSRKPHRRWVWPIVLTVLLLLVLIAGGGAVWWYSTSLQAPSTAPENVTVEIAEGETTDQLLDDLQEKGLIRSKEAAKIYLRLNSGLSHYAGRYELSTGMDARELLAWLSSSDNALPSYAVVTIPEGTWAKDIARIISDALPSISAEELLSLWNDPGYIETLAQSYPFIDPAALNNDAFFVRLEGYLYPETYYMDFDMNADQATRMLLDQFASVYQQIAPEVEASGRSLEEILTFASIIQFESGNPADMPEIAGVFENRLEQNMPLQSSVTVCYALYEEFNTSEDCETRTDIDSPYNTYQNPGLPIGPILNPGYDAIQAALHPADNDYLYFVADIHGDGTVHYARTYEEHEENVRRFNLLIE